MKRFYTPRRIHFLSAFCIFVVILAIAKCINPDLGIIPQACTPIEKSVTHHAPDSIELQSQRVDSLLLRERKRPILVKADGSAIKNRIISVPKFETSFPDLNDVQLATAKRLGIPQIENREATHQHMKDLVYIADNPFYHVQRLNQSIPYLVPRAAVLLDAIARAFNDSLATKGFAPHKLMITSVLRTKADVARLRTFNQNASENSCHQFGTTFDISYNRFLEIKPNGESEMRWVADFKRILSEVLADMRRQGTCYVKYEVHQSCFHITAR